MEKVNHNPPKEFLVTSLEEGKVFLKEKNGAFFISKKTAIKELRNLRRMQHWLKKKAFFVGKKTGLKFTVTVPKVLGWQHGILEMEFCNGINLETELIKNNRHRRFYINLIADVLSWGRKNSLYWPDFAPRNVLFDKENSTITLVDFESNLKIGNRPMPDKDFNLLLQDRIMLELSTLLFLEEQKYLCPNVWKYTKHSSISLGKINGRRRRKYILQYHPGAKKIKHRDLVRIENQIVSIATPFYNKEKIYYPLHELSKIDSVSVYIETILNLEKSERKYWPKIIKKAVGSQKRS